ncbi:DUF4259 domain-containing protein [Herbaspirillum lusitanum]|uniref:DUF4259 domain-containing protein n=1 Tax=Herbaspirillum lusitanum TaxID=213312 RepID=A0ABW9ABC9_9BURK
MGAWSHESFDNDDACDFSSDLLDTEDLSIVEDAFNIVINSTGAYLEAPDAARAIAAAEVLARLQGNWGVRNAYTETVDTWVAQVKVAPDEAIRQKALQAIDRTLEQPSELLDLWQESGKQESWIAAVNDLKQRVQK